MVKNPNIYPYHVFAKKTERGFLFSNITILYGNNASGKSTALNIIANKLRIEGLDTNIQVHHFISSDYWRANYDMVREIQY